MRATTMRQLGGARQVVCRLALFGLAAFLSFAVSAVASAAQFNATVRGKVSHADGSPFQGEKVTIRKAAQDPSRPTEPIEVETDDEGDYNARNVPLVDTLIIFEYEGMKKYEERRDLRTGPVRVDVTMQPVEVSAEFESARIADQAYGIGIEAYRSGDYATAVEQMKSALETLDDIPENAESIAQVYAVLGPACSGQRMFAEAVEAYEQRLGYVPDEAAAHLQPAQALAEAGDDASAQQDFAAAPELDPDDAVTQYNVGVTMVDSGDAAGGIARIERAVELRPGDPPAHKNLGYAYARHEEYAKAIAAFETYLEQDPEADDAARVRDFITALREMIGE